MARRRRSCLRPLLVALGLAFAATPLVWPDGDGPVDAVIEAVTDVVEERAGEPGVGAKPRV